MQWFSNYTLWAHGAPKGCPRMCGRGRTCENWGWGSCQPSSPPRAVVCIGLPCNVPLVCVLGGGGEVKFKNHQLHRSLVTSEWNGIVSLPCSLLLNSRWSELAEVKIWLWIANYGTKMFKALNNHGLKKKQPHYNHRYRCQVSTPPLGEPEDWQTPPKRCCRSVTYFGFRGVPWKPHSSPSVLMAEKRVAILFS